MTHVSINFDRIGFQRDINVAHPIDRLNEFAAERVIGSVAPMHYSVMGSTDPATMASAADGLVGRWARARLRLERAALWMFEWVPEHELHLYAAPRPAPGPQSIIPKRGNFRESSSCGYVEKLVKWPFLHPSLFASDSASYTEISESAPLAIRFAMRRQSPKRYCRAREKLALKTALQIG